MQLNAVATASEWERAAATLAWRSGVFVDGKLRPSRCDESFSVISPRDGAALAEVAAGSALDVDAAVSSARAAFDDGRWSRRAATERGRALVRFGDIVESRARELALRISLEMGKPVQDALAVELRAIAQTLRWYGQLADKLSDEAHVGSPGALALVTREPVGVVGAAKAQADDMRPADPLSGDAALGAVVSEAQLAKILGFVERAVADGAAIAAGTGERFDIGTGRGSYLAPIVLTDVRPDMEIAQQEVFGPVLSVIAVDSVDEAVAVANGTPFGLGAGVWGRDLSAVHQLARRLRAGTVWVNCWEEGDMSMPFGGVGASGFGRDKGARAVDKYVDVKSTWIELDS